MPIKELKLDLLPKIRKLEVFAKQHILTRTFEGNWTALFKGRGIEFTGYRDYTYSDDASLIDWKASLRTKKVLIKDYEEERLLNVFFMVDVSNSMLFSSTGKLKCEYVAELVSSMALAILKAGDAVGMCLFTDRLVTKIDPGIGKPIHYQIAMQLSDPNNYGGDFNFEKASKFLMYFLRKKAVVIIVSDFIGLDEHWKRYLSILSQKYELIGMMVRDPRDRELPKGVGQYVVQDPYSNKKLYIDVNKYADKYKKYVEEEEKAIEWEFVKTRSGFLKIQTDTDFYEPIMTFFKRRGLMKL